MAALSSDTSSLFQPSAGRPRVAVDRSYVEVLRGLHFTWSDISSMLNVSVKTIQRRAKDWNFTTYSSISDDALDNTIREILTQFPSAGEVMLNGHLSSAGVHLQRARLRNSIYRVRGQQRQMYLPIVRREYCVPGPNYLWHADGNHKLIRYRIVVHAAIDGFSRLVTFIKCAPNNTAGTVLEHFIRATSEYGLPSRIRTDRGGENVGIWRYMNYMRGEGRGSYIAGSSVHNARIERLWRDVRTSVLSTYSIIFHTLENEGILDVDNEVDLFCLHYVYLPCIQESLQNFKQGWNHHALSTESGWSPMQLFAAYSIGNPLFDEVHVDQQTYGVDPNDEVEDDSEREVSVPQTPSPLSDENIDILRSRINPYQNTNDYGVSLYLDTIKLVFDLLENQT